MKKIMFFSLFFALISCNSAIDIASNEKQKGNYLASLKILEKVLDNDPQNEEALILRSQIFIETGKVDLAISDLKKISRENDSDVGKWLLGELFYDIGEFDSAIVYLKANKDSLKTPEGQAVLGDCYILIDSVLKGKEILKNLINKDPQNLLPKIFLARAAYLEEEYKSGIEILNQVIENKEKLPDDGFISHSYYLRSLCYFDSGSFETSLDDITMAIMYSEELSPNYYYIFKGDIYLKLGQYEDAYKMAQLVFLTDSLNVDAYLLAANSKINKGEKQAACQNYKFATSLTPESRNEIMDSICGY